MLSPRRPYLALLCFALLVHVGVAVAVHVRTGGLDGLAFRSLDCREFHAIARNVSRHGEFSHDASPPLTPDTWRTPGYSLFLAASMFVVGESVVALVIVQQVLSIVNVLLLFCLARRFMSDRRSGLVAVLFLIEPYHLYYSFWLMSTTWFLTILLLSWLSWCHVCAGGGKRWALMLGLMSGFAVLVRPVALLLPCVVVLGLVWSILRLRIKTNELASARCLATAPPIVLVASLAVVGSWMMRNREVAGHLALSDQGGVVLAYFKAAEVELWRQGRSADRYVETSLSPARVDLPHTVWDDIDVRLTQKLAHLSAEQRATLNWRHLAQGARTSADSFEVSQALGDIGLSMMTSSPVSTLACLLVRCGSILGFPVELAMKPHSGVDTSRVLAAFKAVGYLALCLLVACRLLRRRPAFCEVYFPLACTIGLLVATTPQIDPRFRVPIIPFLLVIALLPVTIREPGSSIISAASTTDRS